MCWGPTWSSCFSSSSCRVRLAQSDFEFPFEIEPEFRFHCAWFGFELEPSKMLSECSPNPPGNAPAGTLEMLPREHPEAPGRDPEKDHSVQLVNNHHTVGDSSRKCRVGSILEHSPISLTLPLSSPKGDGFATTPVRTAAVRASVDAGGGTCAPSGAPAQLIA